MHDIVACVEVLRHMRRDGNIARMDRQSLGSWASSRVDTFETFCVY